MQYAKYEQKKVDKQIVLFYSMERLLEGVVRTVKCDLSTNPVFINLANLKE